MPVSTKRVVWRQKPAIPRSINVRFNLVVREKEITAEAAPVERHILAESHVKGRPRAGDGVYEARDRSYGGISVIVYRLERGIGSTLIWVVGCMPWGTEDRRGMGRENTVYTC